MKNNKMTNEIKKIKLPKHIIVSLVKDDNHPYFRPLDIKSMDGDGRFLDLPNFRELFEMCADKVIYGSRTGYEKIDDVVSMEKLDHERAERYRWSKMSGVVVEGEIFPVRELTYQKFTREDYIEVNIDQTETSKANRLRESALGCAKEAL